MNRWLIPILIIGVATAGFAEDVPAYSMRGVETDEAKFDAIYRAVIDLQARVAEKASRGTAGKRKIILASRLADGLWLAQMWELGGVAGETARAMNSLFGSSNSTHVPERHLGTIALRIDGKRADGDEILIAVKDSGEIHRYVTVLGAEANVRIYEPVGKSSPAPVMSKAEFLDRLKAGEAFPAIQGTQVLRCDDCAGFGRVLAKSSSSRDADGKMPCPSCDGIGKATVPKVWKIVW